MPKRSLPIDALLPQIVETVASHPLTLLEAEPGAGKTTRVPPALLGTGEGQIYVLEPRKLAARMAADRVAFEMGESTGQTTGYRVRFEEVSSSRTRLWYLTEGVLVRMLLSKRALPGISVVVLDEFHERHLETDAALALLRQMQVDNRNLRLLLMSATLAGDSLSEQLGYPPFIKAAGKVFPVSTHYTPASSSPLEEQAIAALPKALDQRRGHVLIFLPGVAEIRKVMRAAEPIAARHGAQLLPLYGDLQPEEQDRAVAPASCRKIICSTNVAESSVTIDGVTAVIDSGLARVRTHSPWSGFSRIEMQRISQFSAIQRAGRAGRTEPGVAIRLYSEAEFVRRPEHLTPEILRSELSELVLLLLANDWRLDELMWLDPPLPAVLDQARELLYRMGAIDSRGLATTVGRKMARLPLHPRLARFVLAASEQGAREEACDLAARLSEERSFRFGDSDRHFSSDLDAVLAVDPSHAARRLRARLLHAVPRSPGSNKTGPEVLEKALLSGYPDRVARRRGDTLLLCGRVSARLDRESSDTGEFLLALDVDDRSDQSSPLVRLAVPIQPDWLLDAFPERIETHEELVWNRAAERVEQVNSLIYDGLALDQTNGPPSDPDLASHMLASQAISAGIEHFTDKEQLDRFLRRVEFATKYTSVAVSGDLVESALRELARGLTSFSELRAAAGKGALLALLESELPMRVVNEFAPAYIVLPSSRRAPIEYHGDRPPSVASRLQDFFGLQQTPTVACGAVQLVIQLLAPNGRPVQVTTDLSSFWKTLYPQLRPQLSRRYPKHAWPEKPA